MICHDDSFTLSFFLAAWPGFARGDGSVLNEAAGGRVGVGGGLYVQA